MNFLHPQAVAARGKPQHPRDEDVAGRPLALPGTGGAIVTWVRRSRGRVESTRPARVLPPIVSKPGSRYT
ncbi:MAG: hypothetical protein WC681_24610, partial [Sterolibacterium sp.]